MIRALKEREVVALSIFCRVIHVRGSRALAVLSAVPLAMVTERAGASTFYVSPVVRAGLANNDALNLMQNCASDIDPSSTYASKCFHGELPFKNPARGDYRPVVPSIAIGTAALTDQILAGARDLRGVVFLNSRGKADIGAYAFTGFQSTLLMIR